ncbi:MAG: HAD hydrolase-like protein [Desulfovibrionaceae bacterium]|nr:HAD hydrolase-like protein [Desulfovibrionaceae bacterium]
MNKLFPDGLTGVIFDCDGVMIDSADANREYYNLILAHFGLPPMTDEQESYCLMATTAQALQYLLPEKLHDSIPAVREKVVNYREKIMPLVKIYPGFLDFISLLHNYDIRMAVLTNRTEKGMQDVLNILGFPRYFDPVVTASSGFYKPRPEGARLILSKWGVPSGKILYVGDSDIDRRTAQACSIPFAAAPGARTPLPCICHAQSYAGLAQDLGLK